jgi:tight adherence protein B
MFWYLILLVLVTSFLLFIALFQLFFLSNKRLEKRMKRYLSNPKRNQDKRSFNLLVNLQIYKQQMSNKIVKKEKSKKLDLILRRAGVTLRPEEFILFRWISVAFSGGLLYLLSGNFLFIFIGILLGYMAPKWWLNKKERDRILEFNNGLADMITTIVGSLRAGFSFPQALKTVAEEAESPIKEEIEMVLKEMQYGSSIEESLNDLYERMPSEDLELMIQAILIQKQVGGNLATVLDKIVQTIRDRTKIQRQILTLTAQGRLSGIVIGLLPIILGFVLYLIEPDYIGSLFTNVIGVMMLTAGMISGIIGFLLIRKLTTIEV